MGKPYGNDSNKHFYRTGKPGSVNEILRQTRKIENHEIHFYRQGENGTVGNIIAQANRINGGYNAGNQVVVVDKERQNTLNPPLQGNQVVVVDKEQEASMILNRIQHQIIDKLEANELFASWYGSDELKRGDVINENWKNMPRESRESIVGMFVPEGVKQIINIMNNPKLLASQKVDQIQQIKHMQQSKTSTLFTLKGCLIFNSIDAASESQKKFFSEL